MSIDWISRSRGVTPQIRNFVDGRWGAVGGKHTLEKYSPRDGKLLYRLRAGESSEVDEAVRSARRAFADGRWSKLPARRRKEVLLKLASLIEKHCEELALLECLDVGMPISDVLAVDVPTAVEKIRYSAEAIDKVFSSVYATDQSSLSYQLRRPMGVIGAIVGWNVPLGLAAIKIGPVLATGNSLVLKPSELTSLCAARVAELAIEAGVPEGVLNVIHGDGSLGAALARHPEVDLITFTGSTYTGKQMLIASGQSNMKQLILECGGKTPNIVFGDAPELDAVAAHIVARAFWNQGEVCSASSRLLVHEGIQEELLHHVIQKASALHPGDPLKPETKFGALASRAHQQKVQGYIDSGEAQGARLVHQSMAVAPVEGGFYLPPTIFDRVSPTHKIAQEEIFGPVLSVISFRDEEDAIRIANNTVYGLTAILWTKDLGRAHRVSQQVDAGKTVVYATGSPAGGPGVGVLPTHGHKESGMGIEGGIQGLEAYTSTGVVQFFV